MANIKISSLEETKINNPDASFVMVVAKDDASSLYKNYRISLSELRNIIGSIEGDIVTGLSSEEVQNMIDTSITADNLKGTVAEVVPDVIPEVIPDTEIQVKATDEPIVLTVKEVVEKVVVQENTVTEITKEIKEDCVCVDHADECFNTIFN